MDHSNMDHSHMDHGGMDMSDKCSMNMLFTWSSKNLCIIFRHWRVTGPVSLIFSLVAVALLTAGYEGVRELARKYEQRHKARMAAFMNSTPNGQRASVDESSSLLLVGQDSKKAAQRKGIVIKAAFYAVQVFYSFFIMLLFMTYNGWIMLAVTVGAFGGYLAFASDTDATKSVACH